MATDCVFYCKQLTFAAQSNVSQSISDGAANVASKTKELVDTIVIETNNITDQTAIKLTELKEEAMKKAEETAIKVEEVRQQAVEKLEEVKEEVKHKTVDASAITLDATSSIANSIAVGAAHAKEQINQVCNIEKLQIHWFSTFWVLMVMQVQAKMLKLLLINSSDRQ